MYARPAERLHLEDMRRILAAAEELSRRRGVGRKRKRAWAVKHRGLQADGDVNGAPRPQGRAISMPDTDAAVDLRRRQLARERKARWRQRRSQAAAAELAACVPSSDWAQTDLAVQTRRTGDALERERARRERRRKQRRRVAASVRPQTSEPAHLRGDDVTALVANVREDIRQGHAERDRLERLCSVVEQIVADATKGASNVEERR